MPAGLVPSTAPPRPGPRPASIGSRPGGSHRRTSPHPHRLLSSPVMNRALLARLGLCLVLVLLSAALGLRPAAAKDELVIGMSQFPPSFHPNMDGSTSKSFIHGMT